MSTNLTYNSLIADIGAYLEKARNTDAESYQQLPRLINLAERAIVTELKLQGYEVTLKGKMTAGTNVYRKPDRWRESISMYIIVNGRMTPIHARGFEYCQSFWPYVDRTAQPKFYAEFEDDYTLIAATPDQDYDWVRKDYLLPKLLDDSNQTNWLTEMAPNALLMRALKETAQFLKKAEDVARFEAEYTKSIGALAAQDGKKIMDRAAERDGV